MANFVPSQQHLREALLFCFNLKKTVAKTHRLLEKAYGKHAPSKTTCEDWFILFRSGNFDIEVKDRSGKPKGIEDASPQVLLKKDDTQRQDQFTGALNVTQQSNYGHLHPMEKIQKGGKWEQQHELTERERENRKVTCEILLTRYERNNYLHRIVTGHEKWIFFNNPNSKKSPYEAPTARSNRLEKKAGLCVWWDQKGIIYYELLKSDETVDGERYQQQLIKLNHALLEKRPEWDTRHEPVILQHDNSTYHSTTIVQDTIKTLKWDLLPHPLHSPDLVPTDYHLFWYMVHDMAGLHLTNFNQVQNWLNEWFWSKDVLFFRRGIYELPERWTKCVASNGLYIE